MRDVDLIGGTLQVNAESAKNPARVRTIPLVNDALWAANSLVKRAQALGSTEPHHFLLPYRHGNTPHDPTRHMSDNGLQKHWHALRRAAGLPWITGHLLRYQCITKMAEGNVDRVTAKRVAGHITDKMWDKYSQVRIESIREKMMEAFGTASIRGSARPGADRGAVTVGLKAPVDQVDPAILAEVECQVAAQHELTVNPMNPAIQAEIQRQVALALQQQQPAKGSRVIRFPG